MAARRIRTIFFKELADILRDRRTLIAMIVVPIVLYPLLTLGSLQVVSQQIEELDAQKFVVGLLEDNHDAENVLVSLIRMDEAAIRERREQVDPNSEEAANLPEPLAEHVKLRLLDTTDRMDAAIRNRHVDVGLVLSEPVRDKADIKNAITIKASYEDVRSANAAQRLEAMFDRISERWVGRRLAELRLPPEIIEPFEIEAQDLSAPESILGQILPLVLVLMTITGAIYPAIDLTAGERERGTLESLMVCPVTTLELIVGKFMVVTVVAIMGAALNLASVSATLYLFGLGEALSGGESALPLGRLIFILLSLIPFAVLMSALMIAVCSYARTFKEAQNYVTPVILAVLIPGGLAALPTSQLEGIMLVMPVGNMVLLARELLLGVEVTASTVIWVLASTSIYAVAAVAVAARIFGRESVVFADAGSLKAGLTRTLIRPTAKPSVAMSLLVTALMFPLWFFVQSSVQPGGPEEAARPFVVSSYLMPIAFVLVPLLILLYWKVDVRQALALRLPRPRFVVAAILIGLSLWVPAREIMVFQSNWIVIPKGYEEQLETMSKAIAQMPLALVVLYLAVVPAVCEELFFRGFVLSGLSTALRRWPAIVMTALMFGVFHFLLFRFAVTAVLGIALGYLCWQSRSIIPAMIAHLLHNAMGAVTLVYPVLPKMLGIEHVNNLEQSLPLHIIAGGFAVLAVGWALATPRRHPAVVGATADPLANA